MDAKGISYLRLEKNFSSFFTGLTNVACELFLIFLMLIDASLSYLLTKFAMYCKLQVPCFLCSRLDHVLGNEKPGYYRNFVCSIHRSEISSLISCEIHEKLVNGLAVCEDCLMSFTSKANAEKLLAGKFGVDFGGGYEIESSLAKICTCCDRPCRERETANRLVQLKTPRSGMTKPNIPLPRRFTYRESLKKMRERSIVAPSSRRLGNRGYDPLSHIGYSELKLNSDSESEFPFSDDDGTSTIQDMEPMEDFNVPHALKVPPKIGNPHGAGYSSDSNCNYYTSNPKRELVQKNYTSELPELVLVEDVGPFSNTTESPVKESMEKRETEFSVSQDSNCSSPRDPHDDSISPSKVVQDVPESSQQKCTTDDAGGGNSRNNDENEDIVEVADSETGAGNERDKDTKEAPQVNPAYVNPSESKVDADLKNQEERTSMAESSVLKDSGKVDEGLKHSLEENSPTYGVPLGSDRGNSQGPDDESQKTEVLSSAEPLMHQDSVAEKAPSSALESQDGSKANETEEESILDQLKRQVEECKKQISSLYGELEEERSASAIAANQAMAMITRLQEEKASLQMEALQDLRMMEEQAEHDADALEKLNDLLTDRERDIQDLEAELDYYRINYGDEPVDPTAEGNLNLNPINFATDTSISIAGEDVRAPSTSSSTMKAQNDQIEKPDTTKFSLSEFEEEKSFLKQCLKDLEKKLLESAQHENPSDGKEIPEGDSVEKSSKEIKEVDLVSMENEMSDLNERLEALETNWNFFEHAFNSLQAGKEGLNFVQEIVHQLKELQKIRFSKYQ